MKMFIKMGQWYYRDFDPTDRDHQEALETFVNEGNLVVVALDVDLFIEEMQYVESENELTYVDIDED